MDLGARPFRLDQLLRLRPRESTCSGVCQRQRRYERPPSPSEAPLLRPVQRKHIAQDEHRFWRVFGCIATSTPNQGVERALQPFRKGRGNFGLLKNEDICYPIGRSSFLPDVKQGTVMVPTELQYGLLRRHMHVHALGW